MGNQEVDDGSPFEFYKFRGNTYDFWRCYACGLIMTHEQERARVALMEMDYKQTICPCGSMKYKPTKPRLVARHKWSPLRLLTKNRLFKQNEWLESTVLTYVVKLVLARGVAPWAERNFPRALPLLKRLSRPTMEA